MMQQILLSYGVGIVRGDYWSLEFKANAYDTSSSGASSGPRVDSSGNVYSAFYFDDSSGNSERYAGLLKTDSNGVLQWARGYSSSSTTVNNYGFDVSSSGTIFHHIRQGNTYIEHQSLATDGTTTNWIKSLGADPNDNIVGDIACRIGASGGHYITGNDKDNIYSYSKLALFKLNSNGGISWARALHGASNQNYVTPGRNFGIDSSENTYHVVNHYEHPFGSGTGYKKSSDIAKYNSSGSIQWKKEYKIGSSATDWDVLDLKGIACDSSGNSYAFGRYVQASVFSGSRGIIIKSNSSGTLQWIKQVPKDSDGYGGELEYSGAVDSSGNFYVNNTGRHNSDRTTVVVHKFNSSGVAQWSRKLYYNASALDMNWGFCSVDSNDNLYVTAYVVVSSVTRIYLIKVPSDGTGTDDYGNVTWASTTTTSISDIPNGSGYSTGTSPLTDASLSQVTATITMPQTDISSPSLNNTSYPS
tara:strand:+ start:32 stop:1447 length:1416 start_codon:yes stop_codon:yes gene_type:complete